MTDLDMIRAIKKGHREYEIPLLNQYNYMIQKHARHFHGYEDDYHNQAYEAFREALDYFDLNKAIDENYKFGRIFRFYLMKLDDDFSTQIGSINMKKFKNKIKGKTSEEIKEIRAYIRNETNLDLTENMGSNSVDYMNTNTILSLADLERKEKVFFPFLSKKAKDIYTLYVKRGERNIEKIADIVGIKREKENWFCLLSIEENKQSH